MTSLVETEWIFILIVGIVLLGASELGVRTGFRLHVKHDEARKSQLGGVQGAVLGLLGLLLGFTFAMAVARYDARRGMVLKEANAIGTTWLRAGLLPGDHPKQVKELLRRYLDVRLEYRKISTIRRNWRRPPGLGRHRERDLGPRGGGGKGIARPRSSSPFSAH